MMESMRAVSDVSSLDDSESLYAYFWRRYSLCLDRLLRVEGGVLLSSDDESEEVEALVDVSCNGGAELSCGKKGDGRGLDVSEEAVDDDVRCSQFSLAGVSPMGGCE